MGRYFILVLTRRLDGSSAYNFSDNTIHKMIYDSKLSFFVFIYGLSRKIHVIECIRNIINQYVAIR